MDESSEGIKNNDRAMKTVILYEALKNTPIFGSYRRFCELVGHDVMEYKDFEFWYYRFYHGQTDFDYDRSADPVPKTIMDMPVSLMYKITENLDTVERTNLRTVNKSLKDVADSRPLVFDRVQITVFANCLNWNLNEKRFSCWKKENGCTLQTPTKKVESDKSFIEKGLEYLTSLFKLPKIHVHHLTLSLHGAIPELDNVPFHATSVKLYAHGVAGCSVFAKHVQLKEHLNEEDLLRFSHLKSFKCNLTFLEEVDFQRIRGIISTFEVLESCELKYRDVFDAFPIRTIAQALEEEIPFGPLKTINHRYPIPESNDYLDFTIEQEWYYCTIKIVKTR
ncbi:hypothetical protein B9Z55_026900 [Caenorhabditis nigoni]|uniref:F-box domain-containing protein n=1 Tax=Caenorhabditis nigoni TaxID=1611254 RepID=A0A2G5SIG2_9PELO|nr:hypothetical protein B9Z55_026900 [Caenorhabditis nigoni]